MESRFHYNCQALGGARSEETRRSTSNRDFNKTRKTFNSEPGRQGTLGL